MALGPLENEVMEIAWTRAESSVSDVIARLGRPLAYTTVMTTLDRLFRKGLLTRRKVDRAFLYAAAMSKPEWQQKLAGEFVSEYLAGPENMGGMLISCLIDAAGQHDPALLDELTRKIAAKKRELSAGGKR